MCPAVQLDLKPAVTAGRDLVTFNERKITRYRFPIGRARAPDLYIALDKCRSRNPRRNFRGVLIIDHRRKRSCAKKERQNEKNYRKTLSDGIHKSFPPQNCSLQEEKLNIFFNSQCASTQKVFPFNTLRDVQQIRAL
jgi:hypothetical protein